MPQIDEKKLISYIQERCDELQKYADDGSAFFFLMAAAFVDFLSCAYYNKSSTGRCYREFIINNFGQIRKEYENVDTALVIYCVMRNGLIHNFSFAPDHKGQCDQVENNTIINGVRLFHEKNGVAADNHMLIQDEKLWISAESFADDIQQVTNIVLSNEIGRKNILNWCAKHPPLAPIGFFDSTTSTLSPSASG